MHIFQKVPQILPAWIKPGRGSALGRRANVLIYFLTEMFLDAGLYDVTWIRRSAIKSLL